MLSHGHPAESGEKPAALVPPKDQPSAKALSLYNAVCLLSLSSAAAAKSKGLANLQTLYLASYPKIADAGVAELQKVLPSCDISK